MFGAQFQVFGGNHGRDGVGPVVEDEIEALLRHKPRSDLHQYITGWQTQMRCETGAERRPKEDGNVVTTSSRILSEHQVDVAHQN